MVITEKGDYTVTILGHYWVYYRKLKTATDGEWQKFDFPTRREAREHKADNRKRNVEERIEECGRWTGGTDVTVRHYTFRYTPCMMVRCDIRTDPDNIKIDSGDK